MEQIQDFDLFFIPKGFGSNRSWQEILGFGVKGKTFL
jgi:hypothetical protein